MRIPKYKADRLNEAAVRTFLNELDELSYTCMTYNVSHLANMKHTHSEYKVNITCPKVGALYFKVMYMTPHNIVNIFRTDERGKHIRSYSASASDFKLNTDSCIIEESILKKIIATTMLKDRYNSLA